MNRQLSLIVRAIALSCLFGLLDRAPLAAQAQESALVLTCDVWNAGLSSDALRAAIETELDVPVRLTPGTDAKGVHLAIAATTQAAVALTFTRPDGSTIERTVDVSNTGGHTDETLALVAANLMRDEAADLLAALREAAQPPAAPPPPPVTLESEGCDATGLRRRTIGLDVLPGVGMSSQDGFSVERGLSLGLFGNMSGAVHGVELSSFVNLVDRSVCGVQFSGGVNLVNGPVEGAQFGMIDLINGRLDGAQFGLIAGARGSVHGGQWGTVALAGGDITGAQFGIVNVGYGSLTGAQFGVASFAARHVTGAQFGVANIAVGGVDGAQFATANVSVGDTRGLQMGLANITTGRVHGAMIGLFNTAADADAPIGLLNILWRGRTHVDIWGTDFGVAAVGIEHGGRYLHNIYGFGMTGRSDKPVFAPVFGIGARVFQSEHWMVDLDVLSYWLLRHDADRDELDYAIVSELRVPVAYRVTDKFALYVSPSINVSAADAETNSLSDPSLLGGARLTRTSSKALVRFWPGFNVGVRFF